MAQNLIVRQINAPSNDGALPLDAELAALVDEYLAARRLDWGLCPAVDYPTLSAFAATRSHARSETLRNKLSDLAKQLGGMFHVVPAGAPPAPSKPPSLEERVAALEQAAKTQPSH